MKYSVVVSSRTGNTKMLADVISARLSGRSVIYTGSPADEAAEADFIFAGFWTDKGSCDDSVRRFLEKLENKTVFLFGIGVSSALLHRRRHVYVSGKDAAVCPATLRGHAGGKSGRRKNPGYDRQFRHGALPS